MVVRSMTWLRARVSRGWLLLLVPAAGLFTGCNELPGARTDPANTFAYGGTMARELGDLYMMTFWWATAVFVVTMAAFFLALWRFRERPGNPIPRQVHGNTTFEVMWTIAPTLVLVIVGIPTIQKLFELEHPPAGQPPLEVEVIGHQWWWEFRYPAELGGFVTASDLHVPVGRPVQLALSSEDVVHSFWPPRLAGKRDVFPVPATTPWRKNHMWFNVAEPGIYYGQCAEFCGIQHAQMRFFVVAQPENEFLAWAQRQSQPSPNASNSEGQAAFLRGGCVACHVVNTSTPDPNQKLLGPNLAHVGSRLSLAGGTLENNDENLARWLHDPQAVKPGTKMVLPNPLSEEDIQTLVRYLRSLQ